MSKLLYVPLRITKGWNKFLENTKFVAGKGDRTWFLEDIWVDNSPLNELFPRLYQLSNNRNMLIQSVISWHSHLNHSRDLRFSRNFSDRECNELISLLNSIDSVQLNCNSSDKRVWVGHYSGEFSCKSFFEILLQSPPVPLFPQSCFIWKSGVPSKIKVFAWLASLAKVNTCDMIQSRRPFMYLSPSWCILCKQAIQNVDHILLHCSFVNDVWVRIFYMFGLVGCFP
ncbi:hypothetical protein LguiB_003329 [Lonicera macranthoides]